MLPRLLDPENEHDYVWVDSAYSVECFEDLLSLGVFEASSINKAFAIILLASQPGN